MKQTGTLILTSPRTGSTWLASMINQTGQMGHCDEWLEKNHFPSGFGTIDDAFYEQLLKLSSTPNGRFSIKVFPWHLYRISKASGVEFIQDISQRYETKIVWLERKDKVAQAISHAKARKSGAWTSSQTQKQEPQYNFERIFRSFLNIQNQDSFWKNYLSLKGIAFQHVFYEDLLENEKGFLSNLAADLNVAIPDVTASRLSRQGDQLNEEWTRRFLSDVKKENLLSIRSSKKLPSRSIKNFFQFINKKPLSEWTTWHASDPFDHM